MSGILRPGTCTGIIGGQTTSQKKIVFFIQTAVSSRSLYGFSSKYPENDRADLYLTQKNHFNIQKLSDLPTVDELGAAGLIDSTNIDDAIFGTGKFYKEKQDDKKEDIYSNIDEMLSGTLDSDEKN